MIGILIETTNDTLRAALRKIVEGKPGFTQRIHCEANMHFSDCPETLSRNGRKNTSKVLVVQDGHTKPELEGAKPFYLSEISQLLEKLRG